MDGYTLRAELLGHDEDVRALCVFGDQLVTASRDKTAKVWAPISDNSFECTTTLIGHSDYVVAAAHVPPGASVEFPQGAIVTGSRDTKVIIWNPDTATPKQVLEGHSYQVTDVAVGAQGTVVSSSLDKTLRFWQHGVCHTCMSGHEGPVLCVVVLADGTVVSGSGDTTVRMWQDNKCVKSVQAHADSVRGMAVVPGIGIMTVSHDQTGKIWTLNWDCLAELVGHTALIYSAAAREDAGLVATASEDNTVKLWRLDGSCVQTIEHPGCVWDVAFLPNGDLVTACADGVARVWTMDSNRAAPQEVQQAFQSSISAKKAAASSSSGGGGGLPAGLTLEEATALLTPGSRDGQTKVIREGGGAVAYSWSAARHEWEKIGDVIGGEEDTVTPGSKVFNGQVYDFVFDVDVEDGAPPKKLAVNRNDNPYTVADQFLLREDLPATYREQIVQFILANTGGQVGATDVTVNVDPFTGGGAYVPRSFAGNATSQTGPSFAVTGGGVDPFTGAPTRPAPAASTAATTHIPQRSFMVYDNVPQLDTMAKKISEMSAAVAADGSTAALALTDGETPTLNALMTRAASTASSSAPMTPEEVSLLSRLLRWPPPCLFPVLDLTRLLCLRPGAAYAIAQLTLDPAGGTPLALAAASPSSSPPATTLTALRLAVNCFSNQKLKEWVTEYRSQLLDGFAWSISSPNKNVRQSMATLLLNYSVLFAQQGADAHMEGKMQVLSALVESVASTPPEEAETLYRSLVAVGTLVKSDVEVKDIASDLGITNTLQALKNNTALPQKTAAATSELMALL